MMTITKYPKLDKAIALDNYKILLQFDNGEKRVYDFTENLNHSYYKKLNNPILFREINITDGEIEWATGQDFCPHTLYEKSVVVD